MYNVFHRIETAIVTYAVFMDFSRHHTHLCLCWSKLRATRRKRLGRSTLIRISHLFTIFIYSHLWHKKNATYTKWDQFSIDILHISIEYNWLLSCHLWQVALLNEHLWPVNVFSTAIQYFWRAAFWSASWIYHNVILMWIAWYC